MIDTTILLVAAATALDGIAAGASLDQSIKQLPARHRIGVVAFSAYNRAADMGTGGLIFYAGVGICGFVLALVVAALAFFQQISPVYAVPIYLAAGFWVLHMLITLTRAAPTLLSQRRHEKDEEALVAIFDRFERWQTVRVLMDVLIFGTMVWTLLTYVK